MKIKIKEKIDMKSILLSVLFWFGATCIGGFFKNIKMQETDIIIVYLICILLTARLTTGYIYGIIVSFGSMLTFNYLFIDPIYYFEVDNTEYVLLFVCMIVAAVMTSMLTSQMKAALEKLRKKEAESRALYQLSHLLMEAQSRNEIIDMTVGMIKQQFACEVLLIKPEEYPIQSIGEGEYTYWEILGKSGRFGYVRIAKCIIEKLTENRLELLKTMLENLSMALDRMCQMEQRRKLDEKVEQERFRSNLLRSISHDIRTPLSGIIGNCEVLLDMTDKEDSRYSIGQLVREDAQWLCSIVENVLNLTRMQEGIVLKKEYEALEEIVESAIRRILSAAPEYDIIAQVPQEMLLVSMDGRLIQQVIMNLLDNAVKHTEKGKDILIKAEVTKGGKEVTVTVLDKGHGIPEELFDTIFEPFYTADNTRTEVRKGMGLGLSICKTIIIAHGGVISVRNRTDGEGTEAYFTLPLEGK